MTSRTARSRTSGDKPGERRVEQRAEPSRRRPRRAGIVEAPEERDEEPEAHAFRHRRDGAERDERADRAA